MICVYCEERIASRFEPDVVGGHGEYAHRRCEEEAARRRAHEELGRREANAQQELVHLRRRVRELEAQLAPYVARNQADPHDPDGGEDDLECPHKG
ncbi:MAG: hypothetical protein Q7R80_02885 [bacterium]|nr:hypothetical protein [bacterium]